MEKKVKLKISVVVPTHNYGRYLFRCLKSIENQSQRVDEIIVIDDNSSDNTVSVVRQFSSIKYFRVKFHQANKARNYGFRKSAGDLLVFFDADDYMKNDFIAKLYAALLNNQKAAFAYCDRIDLLIKNKKIVGRKRFFAHSWDFFKLKQKNYISMPAMIKRKKFPGFDERLNRLQDWDLWLTLGEKSVGVYLPQALFFSRRHDRNISATADLLQADEYIRRKHRLSAMPWWEKYRIKLGQAKNDFLKDLGL